MSETKREVAQVKTGFVLASTAQGTFILSILDRHPVQGYGVGVETLIDGDYEAVTLNVGARILDLKRKAQGDGVVVVDAGANVGLMTVPWARHVATFGAVLAIEAQERLFYALAGNVALNNLLNVKVLYAVLGDREGVSVDVPYLDYTRPGSYGSLEVMNFGNGEDVGQSVDRTKTSQVVMRTIDSLGLHRLDLLKVDVEGMEMAVLRGAEETIRRWKPAIVVDIVKVVDAELTAWFDAHAYAWRPAGQGRNVVAVHVEDPIAAEFDS